MGTSTTYDYDDFCTRGVENTCSNPGIIDVDKCNVTQMEKVFTVKSDTQSRPKPDDLTMNMTSFGPHFEETIVTGLSDWNWIGSTTDYGCPYPSGRYRKHIFERVKWFPFLDPSLELTYPDWSLPLRLRIKDEAVNIGATLAEYRQSVSMFGTGARAIVDAWKTFRGTLKGNRKGLTMCDIAASHLIYDYGIAPLVEDVFSSVEILRLRLERPIYRRFHVKQKASTVRGSRNLSIGSNGTVDTDDSVKGSQYVTAYVEFDPRWATEIIFGNPAELIWEVIPFSFVVDWMIPIGDWLISLDALSAVKDMRVAVSRKAEYKTTGAAYTTSPVNSIQKPFTTSGSITKRTWERNVYTTVPLPPLPRPSLDGSVVRLLNAISLLVTTRGCKGRHPRYKKRDFPVASNFK